MRYFLIFSVCLFPSLIFAQETGDRVIVISNDAELKIDKTVVEKLFRGTHLRIQAVNGGRYWVNSEGHAGWIKRRDVIPFDQGIDYFTKAIRRRPTARDYAGRGLIRAEKGEADAAIADYNEAIRLDPKYVDAYRLRGDAWYKKGDLDAALKDYSEAIRLDPTFALAYNNRGVAWKGKGDLDKAIGDYSEAIRLDPKYALSYNNRGVAWKDKGDLDKAIGDFSEAVRLSPRNAAYYNNRGFAWAQKGDCAKALDDCKKAVQLDSQFALAYNNLAWLYATTPEDRYRDGDEAVQNATKACELTNWTNARFLGTLAAACAEKGDYKQAVKWLKRAIKLRPDNYTDTLKGMLALFEAGKPYREKRKM